MKEYLAKNPTRAIPDSTRKGIKFRKQSIVSIDPKRFRIRMYFESTCPHCKRMMTTLKNLQGEGYFVEAFQIDSKSFEKAQFPIATRRANPEDVKKYGISSVPFTLVADLKQETVSKPITGYQSVSEIKNIIDLMKKGQNGGGRI